MIFGEEWWWYGANVRPGNQISHERIFTGYKLTDTRFAGPTLVQRGDTSFGRGRPSSCVRDFRSLGSRLSAHIALDCQYPLAAGIGRTGSIACFLVVLPPVVDRPVR